MSFVSNQAREVQLKKIQRHANRSISSCGHYRSQNSFYLTIRKWFHIFMYLTSLKYIISVMYPYHL